MHASVLKKISDLLLTQSVVLNIPVSVEALLGEHTAC